MSRIIYGNLAVELEQHEPTQIRRTTTKRKKVTVRHGLPLGEKLAYLFLVLVIVAVSGTLLSRYAATAELNYQIQAKKVEIAEVHKENELLQLEVATLSSPDRILKIAQDLGMSQKEGNVRVLSIPTGK